MQGRSRRVVGDVGCWQVTVRSSTGGMGRITDRHRHGDSTRNGEYGVRAAGSSSRNSSGWCGKGVLVYDCWEWEPAGGQRQPTGQSSSSSSGWPVRGEAEWNSRAADAKNDLGGKALR